MLENVLNFVSFNRKC